MTDLKTAAQQALEALERLYNDTEIMVTQDQHRAMKGAITALRAALAEPVLAPAPGYCKHCKQYTIEEPLPADPVQEPVAKVELMTTGENAGLATRIVEIDDHLRERLHPGQLLYTAPPQRKPLMEGVLMGVYIDFDRAADPAWSKAEYLLHFARAVERAHGIPMPEVPACPDCHGIGYDASGQLCACQENPSF